MNKDTYSLDSYYNGLSVIIATLQKTKGKATLADINKIYTKLGYNRLTRRTYDAIFDELSSNYEKYTDLFEAVYDGKVTIDDVPDDVGATGEVTEDGFHDLISTYNVTHEAEAGRVREFRRAVKDGSTLALLLQELREDLKKDLSNLDKPKFFTKQRIFSGKSSKHLVVALADWHIGAMVENEETGGYSFDAFEERLTRFYEAIKREVEENNITDIHVYHIGDLIEHISMRNVNQAFETQFTMAEQISKGIRALTDFLNLVGKLGNVTFGCVTGNHDRMNGNKKDKVYNDSVMYIALDQLITLKEAGMLPHVEIIDNRADNYSFEDKVAGKTLKIVHGDMEKKSNEVQIPKYIKHHEVDYLIEGHIHTTQIIQEDYSRFHIYVGSIMGANNYSKALNLPTTYPSQFMMTLDDKTDTPCFMPVFLPE